ncbi:MAG: UbiA family prenyltransferase, partial [Chloroflexia bacterium]|nr:UbiA family prenyltransferase [Chloroflexia bacterium]
MNRLDPVTRSAGRAEPRPRSVGSRATIGRTLRAYVALTHPLPIAIVLAATAAFAVLFAGGMPPLHLGVPLMLAMLGGQLAIGALNELVDVELDAATKPWKPIPSGAVSRRGAATVLVGGLATMVLFGTSLGGAALLLLALGTGLGLAYDLWLKRTPWSWLPYVLALPLLPVWVRTA